jgi:hypothetical protein
MRPDVAAAFDRMAGAAAPKSLGFLLRLIEDTVHDLAVLVRLRTRSIALWP